MTSAHQTEATLLIITLQLVVIIAIARIAGNLSRRLGHPAVVGEILAGLLLGRAVELVARVIPPPSDEILDEALRDAQAEAHRLGVTGIHDVEDARAWAGFRRLEQADDLRLRVLFHPPVASLPDLVRRGQRSGAGSAWLGMGGVKLFLDGSLGSRTAWMLEPYQGSRDRGMPVAGEQAAREAMRLAATNGIAVTAHAIASPSKVDVLIHLGATTVTVTGILDRQFAYDLAMNQFAGDALTQDIALTLGIAPERAEALKVAGPPQAEDPFRERDLAPVDDPFEYARFNAFNGWLSSSLHPALGKVLFSRPALEGEARAHAVEFALGKLDLAEQHLVEGPWVFGETWTLSDGYLMVFERWARQAGLLDKARYPKLNAHLDLVQSRDAVKKMLTVEGLQPV